MRRNLWLSSFVFCVCDNKLYSSLSFSYYLLEAYILITIELSFATKTLLVIMMTVHSLIIKGLIDNLHKGRKYEFQFTFVFLLFIKEKVLNNARATNSCNKTLPTRHVDCPFSNIKKDSLFTCQTLVRPTFVFLSLIKEQV